VTPEEHIDAVISGVLDEAGEAMLAELQNTLAEPWPPASVPGEPPHRRNGWLQENCTYSVEQSGPITLLTVISNVPYSAYLEYGTSRMEARPFMGPLQEEWSPVIYQRLGQAFSGPAIVAAA
jgi:hypothetical protein